MKLLGVIGGGTMGAGIAHAGLLAGAKVTLHENDEERAAAARARVERSIGKSAERGKLAGDPAEVLVRLEAVTGTSALSTEHDLVVEAVPEDLGLKQRLLAEVEPLVGPETLLATNTSSISIDSLAADLRHPERFLGLHFFNPVPASQLVEVVVGGATSEAVLAAGREWVEAMDKTAVVVKDAPGFASSRLGVAIGLEAIRMVQEGVASPTDIDAAMTLGYKHPVGPLALTDLVGLDVRLGIAEYLAERLGDRFTPPQLLRDMVAAGKTGKKAGEGFYTYDS